MPVTKKSLYHFLNNYMKFVARLLKASFEKAQGDGLAMAKEYQMLTNELHEKARENLQLMSGVSAMEHSMHAANGQLRMMRSEESSAMNEPRYAIETVEAKSWTEQEDHSRLLQLEQAQR